MPNNHGMEVRNIVISRYKVRKSGIRGATITLPTVWVEDNALKAGDLIEMIRNGDDSLTLVPVPKKMEALDVPRL